MAKRFTRNIRSIKDIEKQPKYTNQQNDLLSDDKHVYIRNKDKYERITGLNDINARLNDLQSRIDNFNPENENIEELQSQLQDLQTQVNDLNIPNYDGEIEDLQSQINGLNIPNYDDEIEDLQSQINGLDIPTDYNQQITITPWQDITIKNDYTASDTPDFKPSYCVVDYGSHKEVFIRFGFENLMQSKNVVGEIPSELVPYKIYRNGTSTTAKIPPKIIIPTSGDVEIHQYENDEYIDTDYVIYQGSWIIHN